MSILMRLALVLSLLGFISSPANAVITALDDSREVPQNTAVVIDVLSNDTTDQPGLIISAFVQPANGLVENADGALRYLPTTGYYGSDQFSYTITNEAGELATATVSLVVLAAPSVIQAASISEAAPRAARNVTRSHRDAVSLFLDSGSFGAINNDEVARWNKPLGGGAGDSGGLSFGGAFLSINHLNGEQKAGDISASDAQAGYDETLNGLTVGADVAWKDKWIAGMAVGLSQAELQFNGGEGDFTLVDASLLGFASYRGEALSVQAQLGYSALDFDFVYADVAGNNRFAFTKVQYAFRKNAWQFIPAISLDYQSEFVEDYIEEDFADDGTPNPAPDSYSSLKNRSLHGGLSLHIDRAMNFNWGVFLPRAMLTYEVELNSARRGLNGFSEGQAFSVIETENDKSSGLIDLGGSFILPRGWALYGNFQSRLGLADYSSFAAQLGFRKEI